MDPAAAAELMGTMGLLGTAWENCGLDIFRWACSMWKLEAAVKGLMELFLGPGHSGSAFPDVAMWNSVLPWLPIPLGPVA